MYKRNKLQVFSLEFSDYIWAKKNSVLFDYTATSAKNPQHGSKQIRLGLVASGLYTSVQIK